MHTVEEFGCYVLPWGRIATIPTKRTLLSACRWASGTLVEAPGKSTSLWSVGEAQRLMLDGADSDPHREKRLRYVNPPKAQPVVVVGSTPLRLLPDPTRAFPIPLA